MTAYQAFRFALDPGAKQERMLMAERVAMIGAAGCRRREINDYVSGNGDGGWT